MTKSKIMLGLSAAALASGLSGAAFGQVAEPVTETVSPPQVVEPEAAPIPAPTVSTPTAPTDIVNPQAQADADAAARERAAEARTARTAFTASRPATRTEAPVAATNEPAVTAVPVTVSEPIPDLVEPIPVAPADTIAGADGEIVETDTQQGAQDWAIAAGIVGALGLAGAGAVLASRRRRRPVTQDRPVVVTAPEPVWTPAVARPQPIVTPAPEAMIAPRPIAEDPIFARQPRVDAHVRDPMFNPSIAKRDDMPPVTDPMFSRKVELPPVTDPMFANHPDYVGPGSKQQGIGTRHQPESQPAWREMEPAE